MDIARQYKRRLAPRRDFAHPDPDDRRSDLALHLRCGSDILDRLGEAGLSGHMAQWADPLCEGPLRSWRTPLDRRRDRGTYLSRRHLLSYGAVSGGLARQDHAIASADRYGEVVLWFEHDLFDQAILVWLLAGLGPIIRSGTVSLICIDRHPSVERFIGLGQLDTSALAALHPGRQRVLPAHVEVAERVWGALTSSTPEALMEASRDRLPELPFLAAALRRYLAEYPSTTDGLGRTERFALEAIAAGATTAPAAFAAAQRREGAPFQGDSMFFGVVRGLGQGARPLLAVDDGGLPPLHRLRQRELIGAPLRLTTAGEAVVAGRDDWFRVADASRWIGGVHLTGPEPSWRWDEGAQVLVRA